MALATNCKTHQFEACGDYYAIVLWLTKAKQFLPSQILCGGSHNGKQRVTVRGAPVAMRTSQCTMRTFRLLIE